MVDTRDLKSLGHCARAGSSPASGTKSRPCESYDLQGLQSFTLFSRYSFLEQSFFPRSDYWLTPTNLERKVRIQVLLDI